MRKLILVAIIIGIVMLGTTVSAGESPEGKPFQAIWDEIQLIWNSIFGLQEQIDNIELITGPEGPQGPPGITEIRIASFLNNPSGIVCCNEGEVATGGGYYYGGQSVNVWFYPIDERCWNWRPYDPLTADLYLVCATLGTSETNNNFLDDFNDGNDDGWTPTAGNWYVENGEYVQNDPSGDNFWSILDSPEITNGIIEVDYKLIERERNDDVSILLRHIDAQNSINVSFYRNKNPDHGNSVYVWEKVNGDWWTYSTKYPYVLPDDYNIWHNIKIDVQGTTLKIYHDTDLVVTHNLSRVTTGQVGLISDRVHVHFDNFKLTDFE